MSRCVAPLVRWLSADPNEHGYRYPVKSPDKAEPGSYHLRDCGKCIGCAARRGLDMSVRAYMEAHRHDRNCVVCLTFNDAPPTAALAYAFLVRFFKRLRHHLAQAKRGKYRYLFVIERGGKNDRVHAHVILFGQDFLFDSFHRHPVEKGVSWCSQMISDCWSEGGQSLGIHHITPGDPNAIFYAAGDAFKNYGLESKASWSKHPLLGKAFMDCFADDFNRNGFITIDGKKFPLPSVYKRRPEYKGDLALLRARDLEFREGQTFDDWQAHLASAEARRVNLEVKLKMRRGQF